MQFDWVNFQQRLQTLQFQRCEYVAQHRGGELHATFVESSPSGSHTLPLALPFAAQPVACQCPGTVNTVGANNLPKPTVTDQGATHRHAMTQSPPTVTFPHQQAK